MRFHCTSTSPIGGLNCEVLRTLCMHIRMYVRTYVCTGTDSAAICLLFVCIISQA